MVEFLETLSETTTVEASILLENTGVADFKMQGKGFGKMLLHLFKVATLDKFKKQFKNLKEEL